MPLGLDDPAQKGKGKGAGGFTPPADMKGKGAGTPPADMKGKGKGAGAATDGPTDENSQEPAVLTTVEEEDTAAADEPPATDQDDGNAAMPAYETAETSSTPDAGNSE